MRAAAVAVAVAEAGRLGASDGGGGGGGGGRGRSGGRMQGSERGVARGQMKAAGAVAVAASCRRRRGVPNNVGSWVGLQASGPAQFAWTHFFFVFFI